ncbi:T9SS type A sorting domain-containing protein [uncultured Winogradskyella sp.]|uniref:T9SS type A sorting domain-containing protein n=1 Tax=uncultured Winogradskyella sp. TaxID=395353 RepID=UPI00260C4148|nr:T9SS type A sorting domain-containing protein [uncultured Winogradskyella sp.]
MEDIIEWVNDTKTDPNIQNVVLGQSMGGVIARYALADMEDNPSLDHDTSLYISHDAPHQGANIPLGIQYFARHLADQFVSTPLGNLPLPAAGGGSITISDLQNVFNSPGTRQLLSNNINGNFNLDNSEFETWQTELQNKGYPIQTRNIAISNGSHCANFQEVGPQQELLYLSGDVEPTIFADILLNFYPTLFGYESIVYIGLAAILENPAYLAGLLPGRTNFNARFEAKTLPNVGQSNNIYKGRIRITKKIDFLITSLSYSINITDQEFNNPNAVQLPLDSYPGGAFNVTFDLSDINDSETNDWLYNLNLVGRSANSFNFIPTPTALDVGGGTTTLGNPDYIKKYNSADPPTGSLAIPFDNYTTSFDPSGANEQHISFNTRNGDWLALELNTIANDEDSFNCTFTCGNEEITGVDAFCFGNPTFSFPAGADTYSWNVVSTGVVNVTSGTNSNSITLSRNGNASGPVTLRLIIDSQRCGVNNMLFTKDIYVGSPIVSSIVEIDPNTINHISSGNGGNCPDIGLELNFTPSNQDVLEIEWEKITTDVTWSRDFDNSNDRYVILYPNCNKDFEFRVRTRNICGWSDWQNLTYTINSCAGNCGGSAPGTLSSDYYEVYPVPTSDNLTVKIKSVPHGTIDPNLNFNIQLFNSSGISVYNTTSAFNPTTFDVSGFLTGTYTLILSHNGTTESFQIIIN